MDGNIEFFAKQMMRKEIKKLKIVTRKDKKITFREIQLLYLGDG